MWTKYLIVGSVAAVIVAGLTARATAQSVQCKGSVACSWYSLSPGSGCLPYLPTIAYACFTSGPWSAQCTVNGTACAPAPYCPKCNTASHPIDLATGDTYITETDVRIPGLGGGLILARTWNSIAFGAISVFGMFGANWTSSFEETVYAGSDNYMHYARGDGSIWSLGFSGYQNSTGNPEYAVTGPGNEAVTLIQALAQTPPLWMLNFQNGEQRVFDGISGRLLSITDRNGNSTQLSYDASFRIVTVTDPASRHLYFSYGNPSSFLVTSVTSDFGVSLSYTYDSMGRLTQYTKPDNTTVSFQYNDPNPSLITAVLDSNGKILESHTYNSCGQGASGSRAGGVEAVTVSYPLACHIGLALAP